MAGLSAQMGSQWTGSRPSVVSLYRHNRVPVPKPQACITPLPWVSRAADLCQLPISAGRIHGVSEPVSRGADDEPNPFVNTLQPLATA